MQKYLDDIFIAAALIGFSVLAYGLHFFLFQDAHHILIYFFGDLAFLGIEALIVYFLIDRMLSVREKTATRKALNMLAGIFFYELGQKMLKLIYRLLEDHQAYTEVVAVGEKWNKKDYAAALAKSKVLPLHLKYDQATILALAGLLKEKEDLVVRLMENPNLHEHEKFSELLMAVFHLTEELLRRPSLTENERTDQEHLLSDTRRVTLLLAELWLEYMQHLKENYKYLYLYNIKQRLS
ncbi:MAG: hypothetical protein WC838_05360 [Candidatus Margulisiibacteriota bacterium]